MLRSCMRVLVAVMFVLAAHSTASADLTAFLGATNDPGTRTTRGLAVGAGLIIVGFEFEFAQAGGDDENEPACAARTADCKPSLTTGMGNVLLQTPRGLGPFQIYGTVGGGVYRERHPTTDETDTAFGTNVGGGVKIDLAGPLRLRLDYRVFRLTGDTENKTPKRFYAGANLAF
ncbi:MAG TPA: outer membrane beta-barrel protein [Vicinamibacterales bacterium]|nr:outer membrane beta-barrel protein [Vicinamibacterales bacterium]